MLPKKDLGELALFISGMCFSEFKWDVLIGCNIQKKWFFPEELVFVYMFLLLAVKAFFFLFANAFKKHKYLFINWKKEHLNVLK